MLDIQFIRDNPELVQEKSRQKGYDVAVDELLRADEERRRLLGEVEQVRAERNVLADQLKQGRPTPEQIEQGKALKQQLAELEARLEPVEDAYLGLLKAVPNMPFDYVPVGTTEEENQVVKTVGEPPQFDFTPKHDYQLGAEHDLIDKERATKIAGSRFVYLKGGLVRLQFALIQFVMQTLGDEQVIRRLVEENGLQVSTKPFTPVLPPAMLRTEPYEASARLNAEEVTYKIEQDDLWLNASAEHTLCTMYWNEILPEDMFPIRYLGYSTSFRREAGTYGKDEEGIFRLHQFDKLELESITTPESGLDEHKLHIAIQEYLMQQIGLSYQFVQKCTADIGKPNAAGVDLNAWFPAQGRWRETHTADYMTDYQTRDLKIRVRRQDGKAELAHTADATAFAMSRILKAIIENNQTADG
ncbi:MAG TPA: serine--tRNA ligase, partial [Nitrososphaera sp.]|nr:serine--tRNA ligase [Nitrososphaera sp.]